eukprot:536641_1
MTRATFTYNTASNGVLFSGTNLGNVSVSDLDFQHHNNDLSDGEILILFNEFINLKVETCIVSVNAGNYLFKGKISRNIQFTDCSINKNDISQGVIYIDSNGDSEFIFQSSNITENKNLRGLQTHSTHSLINITYVSIVELLSVIINDNVAANYFVFNGNSTGNLVFENIQLLDNKNVDDSSTNNVLILAENFIDASITNCAFSHNNQGISLIQSTLTGDVKIFDSQFTDNTLVESIINMNGISEIELWSVMIQENIALNGIIFNGNGDVNTSALVHNFEFKRNNFNISLDATDTLIEFNYFDDLMFHNCSIAMNSGNYLFIGEDLFTVQFTYCDFDNNNLNTSMISIVGHSEELQILKTNISHNSNGGTGPNSSMKSLITMNDIDEVGLQYVNIKYNHAAQYLIVDGSFSSDFEILDSNIIGNVNDGPFVKSTWIEANGFIDTTITNTVFVNNKNGNVFLAGSLNGAANGSLLIEHSNFVNNDEFDTIIDMNGTSYLKMNSVKILDNTVKNGILFSGVYGDSVYIEDLNFTNNGVLFNRGTLIQFNGFTDVDIINGAIVNNHANYLLDMDVIGDIVLNDCDILQNYINLTMIKMISNEGTFMMQSVDIINNMNVKNDSRLSIDSLIIGSKVGAVRLQTVNIKNNSASQYIKIDGTSSGNLDITDTKIEENQNKNTFTDTLIEMNHFKNGIISHSDFRDNDNGKHLFIAIFDGDLNITNVTFTGNDVNNSLIAMKGISTLTTNTIVISDNNAIDGVLFNGTNTGPAIVNDFRFNNHNIYSETDANNLVQIINFKDFEINDCNLQQMSGDYIFDIIVSGNMSINNCNIHDSEVIAISIIKITGDYSGIFSMKSINITHNKNNASGVIESMKSVIEVTKMKSVLLSQINVNNNYASQYLTAEGNVGGNFKIEDTQFMNNINNGLPANVLINANNFMEGTVTDSNFINNDNGDVLFKGSFNGSLMMKHLKFTDNNDLTSLIDITGISMLKIDHVDVRNNTAENGILFD